MRSAGASTANGPPAIARTAAARAGTGASHWSASASLRKSPRETRRQEEERDGRRCGEQPGAEDGGRAGHGSAVAAARPI